MSRLELSARGERGDEGSRPGRAPHESAPSHALLRAVLDRIDPRIVPSLPSTEASPDKEVKPARRAIHSLPRTEASSEVVAKEGEGLVKGTLKAFSEWLVQRFADAHGVGLLLKAVKWTIKIAQWMRVDAGEGGVEVSMPIPVGSGVDFQMSVQVGGDPDGQELPFNVCFAPSDDSPVGLSSSASST